MTLPVINSITRPDPFDSWGALTLPTTEGKSFSTIFDGWGKRAGQLSVPPSDGTLACCLDWLAVFLETDGELQGAWQSAKMGADARAVRTIWLHNPKLVSITTTDLPGIYMWREKGTSGYIADDYLRANDVVKALWIFPWPGSQEKQRIRSVFTNAVTKAIPNGIERGRTPGWKQPNDPDRLAAAQGSLFYTFAGFDEFSFVDWKHESVRIEKGDTASDYYGLELTFAMAETQVYGIGRQPPYYPDTSLEDTVQTEDVVGAVAPAWAPLTFYGPAPIVQPTTPNGFFYVGLFANTRSGESEPNFPTTPGATVTDGSQTWTCVGRIDGTSVTGVFAP